MVKPIRLHFTSSRASPGQYLPENSRKPSAIASEAFDPSSHQASRRGTAVLHAQKALRRVSDASNSILCSRRKTVSPHSAKSSRRKTVSPHSPRSSRKKSVYLQYRDIQRRKTVSPHSPESIRRKTVSPHLSQSPRRKTVSPQSPQSQRRKTVSPNSPQSPRRKTVSPHSSQSPRRKTVVPNTPKSSRRQTRATTPTTGGDESTLAPGRTHYTVMVLGDRGVGKTELVRSYCGSNGDGEHSAQKLDPVEVHHKTLTLAGEVYTLDVLDIGQVPKLSQKPYIEDPKVDGFILCFSLKDAHSFHQFHDYKVMLEEWRNDVPVVVAGCKLDGGDGDWTVSDSDVDRLVDVFQQVYIETSARERVNVNRVFEELVGKIRARLVQQRRAESRGAVSHRGAGLCGRCLCLGRSYDGHQAAVTPARVALTFAPYDGWNFSTEV